MFEILLFVGSIPLIYGIGKILFNKKVGWVAAFILGGFWSMNFYTHRILVDVPVMFMWLACIYFFFKGYKGNFTNSSKIPYKNFEGSEHSKFSKVSANLKWMVIGGVFLTLSFLTKYSSITLIGILAIYCLTTERFKIIKSKKMWAFWGASLVSVLPFFIWQMVSFGSPIAFLTTATSGEKSRSFIASLFNQTSFSISLMHSALIVLFLIGAVFMLLKVVLMYDKILSKESKANNSYFVLLWLALALLFFGYLNYGSYMDERYYFVFYPAIFLISAKFLIDAYNFVKKYGDYIAIGLVVIVLGFYGYQQVTHVNGLLVVKSESFKPIKDAGLWLKQNSEPGDVSIVSEEYAEFTYYSERNLYQANNETEMYEFIEAYNAKYMVVALYYAQGYPDMVAMINHVFANGEKFERVQGFGPAVDQEERIPVVSIFRIKKS